MGEVNTLQRNAPMEQNALGAILIEPNFALPVAAKVLTVNDFAYLPHRWIYDAILTLHGRGEPVDLATVSDFLRENGHLEEVGTEIGLMCLMDTVPGTGNIDYYCGKVKEASLRRQGIEEAKALYYLLRDDPDGLKKVQEGNGRFHFSQRLAFPTRPEDAEPVPLPVRRVAPFPVHALPDWLCVWVTEESAAKETPLDLQGLLALGAVSAALTGRVQVQSDWTEPVNLYLAPILPSGERKSPSFDAAIGPLRRWERRRIEKMKAQVAEAETEKRILEARRKKAEGEAAGAKDALRRGEAETEARSLAGELAAFSVPPSGKLLADDVTPEEFIRRLHLYGGKIAILSDEAGLFSTFAGRYNDGIANLDALCKAYDGSPIRNERAGREEAYDIPRPLATVLLTPQPFIIEQTGKTPALTEQGALARFLFALPQPRAGFRTNRAKPTALDTLATYDANLMRLLEMTDELDDVMTLRFSRQAAPVFLAFRDEVELMLRPEGELCDIMEWGNKLPGKVMRIAGLLHMAEGAGKAEGWAAEISAATVSNAIEIGRYAVSHARAALGQIKADPTLKQAKKVLEWLAGKQIAEFTRKQLQRAKPTLFPEATDCDKPLQMLEEHGYIRAEKTVSEGPGRPASAHYVVSEKFLLSEKHLTNLTKFDKNGDLVKLVEQFPGSTESPRFNTDSELQEADEEEDPFAGELPFEG